MTDSKHRKDAIKLLSTFSCTTRPPSRRKYCHVRDFLLTYIIIDNGSRSGYISNMTVKEFRNADVQSDELHVSARSQDSNYGWPCHVINYTLMRHLQIFVQKIRNNLDGIQHSDRDSVFSSRSGKKMVSSMINMQQNSFRINAINLDLERSILATL